MLFTEGKLKEYECMMTQKPGFDKRPIRTMAERDCKHCLHFDEKKKRCKFNKCAVFDD